MPMERFCHYQSDTKDLQGSLKLTLDELHLEIQVVENLPRNSRTLDPSTAERRQKFAAKHHGYMKFPPFTRHRSLKQLVD